MTDRKKEIRRLLRMTLVFLNSHLISIRITGGTTKNHGQNI